MLKNLDYRAIAGGLLTAAAIIGLMLSDLWPLWLLVLAIGMVLLTTSLSNKYEYECQKCHGMYRLGIMGVMMSKHGRDDRGSWAISRCPHCGAVTKAKESRSHGKEKG